MTDRIGQPSLERFGLTGKLEGRHGRDCAAKGRPDDGAPVTISLPARCRGSRRRPLASLAIALLLGGCTGLRPPAAPSPTAGLAEPEGVHGPATAPATPRDATPEAMPAPPPRPPRITDGRLLFERLAVRLTPPVCVRGERNRAWRRRYAAHPAAFERQLRQALHLMAHVVEDIERRGLPGEFALIPIIESGYRPDARGPGGPTGLWQMIGSTARNRGLRVDGTVDERLSPTDSTRAALDHLALLHGEFGDWRTSAMAYNAGEGRLRRAFARHGENRVSGERLLPPGLSGITYAYVAKLHALACLVKEPQRHGLRLPHDAFVPLVPDGASDGIAERGLPIPD